MTNGDSNWPPELLKSGLTGVHHPLPWQASDRFREWIENRAPDKAQGALRALWKEDDLGVADRIRTLSDALPRDVASRPGVFLNLASVLLMGIDAEQFPPFRINAFNKAYDRTGYHVPGRDADEATRYEHALDFLDRLIEEASRRQVVLRHRLDAQTVVWRSQTSEPLDDDDEDNTLPEEPEPTVVRDLLALADELYLTVEFLEEIEALLEDKKQVIFQGPPGTGKTFVAQKLARHLAGSADRVTLVQLHPSYAYEDFVQGFRPTLNDKGQPGFELRDGPLLRAAKRARSEAGEKHFLVIDEINRGAPAKVLGELYFLLEYRDEKVRLQYQRDEEEDFSLPPNLYFIGTMNTADRSIALVDLALRRRFYFVEFHPDDEPVKSVLRRWIDEKAPGMEWVADVVERANVLLQEDRHAAIGPSYFMKDGLDETAVERIWKHSVLSYIEERLFGEGDRLGQFDLDRLRRETGHSAAQGQDVGPEGDEEDGTQ